MGARNVSAVFALWPTLPPLPKVLLLGMALQSLDTPSADGRPARVFFGGQDALVEFTGRSRTAAYRALKALRESGAVEVLDAGRNGHRAVYKLALDPLAEGSQFRDASTLDEEEPASRNRDAKGSRNRDGRVPESGRKGPESGTPRKDEEEQGDHEKEEPSLPAPPHLRVVGGPNKDYDDAYQALVERLGLTAAVDQANAYAAEHDIDVKAAVIELAGGAA